jgi:hypothetical protein
VSGRLKRKAETKVTRELTSLPCHPERFGNEITAI